MTRRSIRPSRFLATVTAASLALALLSACGNSDATVVDKPTPVRVAIAGSGPATPPISTTGLVANKDEMRLSFKVGGVIERIAVNPGDVVRKGQRLAEIELTEVGSQVAQARELADKARRDLERGERLYADQVISLEQLQDLRTQASVARAGLNAAAFNLDYAVITAPRDGVVLRRMAEERELVPAGTPILVLGARDRGYVVRAALADREVVQLRLGDSAEVRLDAYPGQVITGRVSEIASGAEERSRLFPIEVRIDDPPGPLASGLVAKLRLVPSAAAGRQLTYVPIAAVVEGDGDRASVYVVVGERAKRRAVRVAFILDEEVALADGLKPGERIVTDGALYLADDEPIRAVTDASQTVGGEPGLATAGDDARS